MLKSINTLCMRAGAVMVTGTLLISPAFAGNESLDDLTKRLNDETKNIPQFINIICYICGIATIALGVVKLKQHIDQPTQFPLKDGIARIVFGALLVTLPFLIKFATQTVTGTDGGQTAPGLGTFNFTP